MHSVPPENSGELFQLYQEQLAHKDSQIAELTALLREANDRLAQQQRISESFLATLAPSPGPAPAATPGTAPPPPAVKSTRIDPADGRMGEPTLEPGLLIADAEAGEGAAPPIMYGRSVTHEHTAFTATDAAASGHGIAEHAAAPAEYGPRESVSPPATEAAKELHEPVEAGMASGVEAGMADGVAAGPDAVSGGAGGIEAGMSDIHMAARDGGTPDLPERANFVDTETAGDLDDGTDRSLSEQPGEGSLKAFDPASTEAEPPTTPIPIAYFGAPLAGLAQNLKEATAAQEPLALSEIPEDEDMAPGLRANARQAARGGGESPWRIPIILTTAVVAIAIVFGMVWQTLSGGPPQPQAFRNLRGLKPITGSGLPNLTEPAGSSSTAVIGDRAAGDKNLPAVASGGQTDPALTTPSAAGEGTEASKPARDAALDARLVAAVSRANLPRVRSLLAAGADVNARNSHGSTVLAIAARQGYSAITERLLSRGADVNAGNDRGWTALMLAVNYRHPRIVNALLRHGARTDAVNSQGTTALMLAAQQGDPGIVNSLLASGAPVMVRNHEGRTAQDLALQYGHRVVAAALTQVTATKPTP